MTALRTAVRPSVATGRPPSMSRREDLVTGLLGTWLITGLFLDGWAHNTKPQLETFITPWHAVFYTGFLAVAAWIAVSVKRRMTPGTGWWDAVPAGYRSAVVGLAVFHVAGAGDAAWHAAFGIEHNEAALLSPTHLGLYVGALLIVSAPLRSQWSDADLGRRQTLRTLGPAILSLALAGSLTAFILQNFSPIREDLVSKAAGRFVTDTNLQALADRSIEHIVASFVLTTVFLFGPILLLTTRWDIPRGAVIVLVGSQCILMQGLRGFDDPGLAVLGVLGGGLAELLRGALRPAPDRIVGLRAWAALAPAALWGCYLAGIALHDHGLGWKAEIWGGALVWTALTGLGMTVLLYPAAPEAPAADRP